MRKYKRRYRNIKFISALLITYGIVIIYVSANSSDLGAASLSDLCFQLMLGLLAIAIGLISFIAGSISYKRHERNFYRNIRSKVIHKRFIREMKEMRSK